MKEALRSDLDSVLNLWEERQQAELARLEEIQQEKTHFIREFSRLRREVIRPCLEEFARVLTERGHNCRIEEEDYYVHGGSTSRDVKIGMNIFIRGKESARGHSNYPFIAFLASKQERTVRIQASTRLPGRAGTIGSRGHHPLDELTREFIEAEMISFLREVLEK